MLAYHCGDFAPTVDPAQLDLPACHEAEEQDQGRVFGRERTLRLHAAPDFFVGPLDRVRGSQRLPLRFGEGEEREEFVAAFPQARHHAGAALGPRALEGREGGAGSVTIRSVDDPMEVVANVRERVLRGSTFEVPQLVDAAALYRGSGPYQSDRAPKPGIAVDDAEHRGTEAPPDTWRSPPR